MTPRPPGRPARRDGSLASCLVLALPLAGCGEDPPPPARTVGSAVVAPVQPDREAGELRRLDAAAVASYFSVRLPPGTEGVLARELGFMDDTAVARLTIPADDVRAFVRDAGLEDEQRCDRFGRKTLGDLSVGPVAADGNRVRCFTASAPDSGRLAERTIALVEHGPRVEVLLAGLTT